MMKSLCIVSTQMQLLNSIELLQRIESENNELVIIAPSITRRKQIEATLKLLELGFIFEKVTIIEPKYKHSLFNSFHYKKQIRRTLSGYAHFDSLVISNYKEITIRYSYYCIWKKNPYIKTFIVDDGLSIYEIIERRNKELKKKEASINLHSRHLVFVYPNSKLKDCIASKLVFFTNHEIKEKPKVDTIMCNDYRNLKNIVSRNIQFNDKCRICIIGQPLPQIGVLNKDTYCDCLDSFINHFGGESETINYIPHPTEFISDNLDDRIRNRVTIVRLDLPIEIYSLKFSSDIVVVSFYSAALNNIHRIRPEIKIYCIYPIIEFETNSIVKNAYASLISAGIEAFKITK